MTIQVPVNITSRHADPLQLDYVVVPHHATDVRTPGPTGGHE